MSKINLKYSFYRSIWCALDQLFPPVCGGCGKPGSRWCGGCQETVKRINATVCDVCGLPQEIAGICKTCVAERPHFYALRSWAEFDNPVKTALHKLKYRRDISLGDALAADMLAFLLDLRWPIDLIIPIPLGEKRLQERGYNQVGMIARPLAMAMKLEYAPRALWRKMETRSQVGLTREERRENVRNAFLAGKNLSGRAILIFDDVATTGSTLSSAAEALLAADAKVVYAVTVARALPHHGLTHA